MTWQTIVESVIKDFRHTNGYNSALSYGLIIDVEKRNLTKEITQNVLNKMHQLPPTEALIEACRDYGLKVDL